MTLSYDTATESTATTWTHDPSTQDLAGMVVIGAVGAGGTVTGADINGYAATLIGSTSDTVGEIEAYWLARDYVNAISANFTYGRSTPTFAAQSTGDPYAYFYDMVYDNGYFVAVGDGGRIWTSTDGDTWTAANSSITDPLIYLTAVGYGNGLWVAVGAGGTVVTATDPTGTWTKRTGVGITTKLNDLAYNGTHWATVSSGGAIRYATDPTGTWSGATSNTTVSLFGIGWGNGRWVAVGGSGTIVTSTAMTTAFSAATSNTTVSLFSASYTNSTWVVGGGGVIRYTTSPTGSWSTWTSPTTSSLSGAEYMNGEWVFWSGITGQIYVSATLGGSWTTYANIEPASAGQGIYVVVYATVDGVPRYVAAGWETKPMVATNIVGYSNSVSVTTTAEDFYGQAIAIAGAKPTEIYGLVTESGSLTLAERSVDDGSPGTNSIRIGAVNSSLTTVDLSTTTTASDTLVRGANSTAVHSWSVSPTRRANVISSTVLSLTAATGTSITTGSTTSSTFAVAFTILTAAGAVTPGMFTDGSAAWSIRSDFTAMSTPYEARFKLQRRNSGGTVQSESGYTAVKTATGAVTDTLTWDSGTWATGDRLALILEHRRPSGTGSKSSTLAIGGSTYVDGPNATPVRVVGSVRETTAGQGSRSIGFQSTTSASTAGIYFAVRETPVPVPSIAWIVGSVARA